MSVFTNREKRIAALRSITIFANLPKKDVLALDQHVTGTTLEKGADLAREGRAPTQMFLIVEGTATVRRNKRKLAQLGPGDTVGELSLLDGGKQSATVTADGDMAVLVVAANEFKGMLHESPTFANNLLKSMAMRLREADDLLGG